MNLREQEYVLAIAKHNSIKHAAEELFITPSSLSVFLKELEEREGILLFNRIGKKLFPTVAGNVYVETARKMVLLKQSYAGELSDLRNEVSGVIRFGLHSRRANYLLSAVLPQLKNDYPNVRVVITECSTGEMIKQLGDGQLDLILANRISPQNNFELREVYQDQLLMVTAKGHRAASLCTADSGSKYPWIDLALIAEENFIVQEKSQTIRSYTDEAFAYARIIPHNTFVIQNLEAAAKLASSGYGAAFNFETYLMPLKDTIPFDLYAVGNPDTRIRIHLAYNKNAYCPAYLSHFIRLIQESFARTT